MFLNAPAKLFVRAVAMPPVSSAIICRDSVVFDSAADVTLYDVACWLSAVIPSLPAARPPAWIGYIVMPFALAVFAIDSICVFVLYVIASSMELDCQPF